MIPAIRLARTLVGRGHSVTLATSKHWVSSEAGAAGRFKAELHGIRLLGIEDGLTASPADDMAAVMKEHSFWLPRSGVEALTVRSAQAAEGQLHALHAKHPIDYAILDMFAVGWAKALRAIGVDFCCTLSGPAHMLWMFQHDGTEDWSWLPLKLRMEFSMLHLVIGPILDRHKSFTSKKPWILNSFKEVEIIPETIGLPAPCCYVGPLATGSDQSKLDGEIASFCDGADVAGLPIVYVSLGSGIVPDAVIANAIHNGLAGGPWRVVWSLKTWSASTLPDTVDKEQFFISPWVPQHAVLSHPSCKVFLTHCGWGGLMEAAGAGVPLLALPYDADQPANALLVERKGWGLQLPGQWVLPFAAVKEPPEYVGRLEASDVRTKVTRLLEEPSFAAVARELQAAALRYGGCSSAAAAVESWAAKSPLVDDEDSEPQQDGTVCASCSLFSWAR